MKTISDRVDDSVAGESGTRAHRNWVVALTILFIIFAVVAFVAFKYQFNWGDDDDIAYVQWYRDYLVSKTAGWASLLAANNGYHALAFQIFLGLAIFSIAGINFSALIVTNFFLLFAASILLVVMTAGAWRQQSSFILSVIVIPILLFHPTQANHLFWAFEIGWFIINFFLVANACLLETKQLWAIPLVAIFALLGTYSSIQGIFLWLAVAAHCALLRGMRGRWWASVLFAIIFVVYFLLLGSKSIHEETPLLSGKWHVLLNVPLFFVDMYGAVFGVKDPNLLPVLGIALIAISGILAAAALRRPGRIERIGLILMFNSLLSVAAFSVGRISYGLGWVLDRLHVAPLAVPFLLGCALLALKMFDDSVTPKLLPLKLFSLLALGLVVLTFWTSLPYASQRAHQSLIERGLAMKITCTPNEPKRLVVALNHLEGSPQLLWDNLAWLKPLCRSQVPETVTMLLHFPRAYTDMIAANPSAGQPLHNLWQLYLIHGDLRRGFPIGNPQTPVRLLAWAKLSAGSYPDELLTKDIGFYRSLPAN